MRGSAGYAQGTISAPSKAPMNILFMIKNSTVVCQVWLSPKKVKKIFHKDCKEPIKVGTQSDGSIFSRVA